MKVAGRSFLLNRINLFRFLLLKRISLETGRKVACLVLRKILKDKPFRHFFCKGKRREERKKNKKKTESFQNLISIMVGLEGSLHRHSEVFRLLGSQLRQLDSQFFQVQARNLFIQGLGKDIHLLLILVRIPE